MLKTLLICYNDALSPELKQQFFEDFKKADTVVLLTLFSYLLFVTLITSWHNGYFLLGIIGGGLVFSACFVAYKVMPGTPMSRIIMAVGLTVMMAITIQQANGLGEGHFIFFLNFTILIRYRDIVPLAVLVVLTVVHHLTLTYCQAIGVDVAGTPLIIFSWGEESSLGILAPLIYHVIFAVLGTVIATYYILEGNVKFLETNKTIGLVQQATKGDLSKRIDDEEPTPFVQSVNGFFDQLNDVLGSTLKTATGLDEQSLKTQKLAKKCAIDVQEQHDEVSKITLSVGEMNSATREIAANSERTATALKETVKNSEEGRQTASQFGSSINDLSDRVAKASDTLSELEKSSQQINTIVATIRSISEQTNLLALNAAIEAARAGEQGRGFAVVADEVRVLSQRTHDSTEEISAMIGTLQTSSHSAVQAMAGCQQVAETSVNDASLLLNTFEEIADAIGEINEMAIQIATAAEQQAVVNDEISQNTIQIKTTTEQFSTTISESLGQASELAVMSDNLTEKLKLFTLKA